MQHFSPQRTFPRVQPRCNVRSVGSRRKIATGVAGLLLGAAPQVGCGSSGSRSNADPATLVPASAPLYVSVAIKPSGGSHGDATSDLQRVTHLSDPFGELAEALLQIASDHPRFRQEIAPWVGNRAGIFLTRLPSGSSALGARAFGSRGGQGAIVLDTSDLARARAFLARRARAAHAHAVSYRGVDFELSPSGEAEGVVDGFAVIGSESGVKQTIDTARGASPVSHAGGYLRPPASAIASAYLAPPQLSSALHSSPGRSDSAVGALVQLLAGARSAALYVTPAPNSLSLQGELSAESGFTPLFGEQGAQMLRSLPSGAWLGIGVGDLGSNLSRLVGVLRAGGAGGADGAGGAGGAGGASSALSRLGAGGVEQLLTRLGSPRGLRGLARWAGPAGVYASGSGLLELQAGVVVDAQDASAARAGVGQLASLARSIGAKVARASIPGTEVVAGIKLAGFPAVVYVAAAQSKLVVGLGQASVVGALHPTATLAGTPSYASASALLGEGLQPSAIVEFPALLSLLEAIGLAQTPPISSVVPYLKSLGTLVLGSVNQRSTAGTTIRFRAVLGLAGGGSGG